MFSIAPSNLNMRQPFPCDCLLLLLAVTATAANCSRKPSGTRWLHRLLLHGDRRGPETKEGASRLKPAEHKTSAHGTSRPGNPFSRQPLSPATPFPGNPEHVRSRPVRLPTKT